MVGRVNKGQIVPSLILVATSSRFRHTKGMDRGTFATTSDRIQDQTMYFTRHIRPAVIETLRLYTLIHKCAMPIHMQTSGADKHTTGRRAPKELFDI